MSPRREIRVGVIGLGFMGRAHVAAYQAARAAGWACRLAGFCDNTPQRLPKLPGSFGCTDPADLLAKDEIDLVSICTRTDSHVELAMAALDAGRHVLVEKPVGLNAEAVGPLARRAAEATPRCIPAHCMRFWPGWDTLKEAVTSETYGRVRSATFQRLSSPPDWSSAFYGNPDLSGGALVDLHLHDSDFVRWCFGDPKEVVSTGSLDHVTTLYRFGATGPEHVIAEGGWNHTPGFGFRMRYVVVFERATLDFELSRDPRLLLHREGRSHAVALPAHGGYDGEVRHVLDLILGRAKTPVVTMEDALGVARLLDAERESLETGRPVRLAD